MGETDPNEMPQEVIVEFLGFAREVEASLLECNLGIKYLDENLEKLRSSEFAKNRRRRRPR